MKELYLHVGNGGVTFSVCDNGFGPEICIETDIFGNLSNKLMIKTDVNSLAQLSVLFAEGALYDGYSRVYDYAARARKTLKDKIAEIAALEESRSMKVDSNPNKDTKFELLADIKKKIYERVILMIPVVGLEAEDGLE